jgi:hypothetical protein
VQDAPASAPLSQLFACTTAASHPRYEPPFCWCQPGNESLECGPRQAKDVEEGLFIGLRQHVLKSLQPPTRFKLLRDLVRIRSFRSVQYYSGCRRVHRLFR